ncbi:Ig-like domain-containing protein [uncultured Legionella sp.]|uniref:Ig-like domain-containing protein n=1 Tax=uncultured Legionella sp. TaxID=210934 RepID=UPI0026146AB9|nr:Ig-like domain-containing protein [uncultured Legionella sp.]
MLAQTVIGVVKTLNGLLEKVNSAGEAHFVKSGAPLHQGDMLTLLSGEAYVQFINGFPEALALYKPLLLADISPSLKFNPTNVHEEIIQEAVSKGIEPALILDILEATASGLEAIGSGGDSFYVNPIYGSGVITSGFDTLSLSFHYDHSELDGVVYQPISETSIVATESPVLVEKPNLPEPIRGTFSGEVTESGGFNNSTGGVSRFEAQLTSASGFKTQTVVDDMGTFKVDADSWSYTLDNENPIVNALKEGEQRELIFIAETQEGDKTEIKIIIVGSNDAPSAEADFISIMQGDRAFGNVLENDSDPERDALSITSFMIEGYDVEYQSGQMANIEGVGELTIDEKGLFSFIPGANYHGSAPTVIYKVTDGAIETSSTLSITVVEVKEPLADGDELVTVVEDRSISGNVLYNSNGSPDTRVTTFTIADIAGEFQAGEQVLIDGVGSFYLDVNGNYAFTPIADYNGPVPLITYTTVDGDRTTTATINITVEPEADVVDDVVLTNENTEISFNVIIGTNGASADNFSDPDRVVTSVTQGEHGRVVFNSDGTLTYIPEPNYTGPDSFTYTVTSGGVTETGTVSITVQPVQDPLIDGDDFATLYEDTEIRGNVLYNSNSGPDTRVTTFTIAGMDSVFQAGEQVYINGVGILNLDANGNCVFTPIGDWNGVVPLITYTIVDGNRTTTATINITVEPEADVVDDKVVTKENTEISFNVITGTNGASADHFENSDRMVTAVTQGAHGKVVFSADGTLKYIPDLNYSGSDSFTYTVTSGGVTEIGTVNVIVNPVDSPPIVEPAFGTVSEEGLPLGIPDSIGTSDATDSTMVTGTIHVTDIDSTEFIFILTAPEELLTSNGVPITWSLSDTGILSGSANGIPIATVSVDANGNYVFTLTGPIDHPESGVEDTKDIIFGVHVSDGSSTTTSTLTIRVEDDAPPPIDSASTPITETLSLISTNLLIVLDISGSMALRDTAGGPTRLANAQASITRLLEQYESLGDVRVRIVTFSTNANALGSAWTTVAQAKAQLNALRAEGGTNYDEALADAINAFDSNGKIAGAQNVSYFFSDGEPTFGSGTPLILSDGTESPRPNGTGTNQTGADVGIQAAEESIWLNFLKNNHINSFAIGMGTGITNISYLHPIAYDGRTGVNTDAILVRNTADLDATLDTTLLDGAVGGDLVSGGSLYTNNVFGADGGYVSSITVEGTTYTFNYVSNSITVTGADRSAFNVANSILSINTSGGGVFEIALNQGTYIYHRPINSQVINGFSEVMNFTLTDFDGDSSSSSVTVTFVDALLSSGSAADDTITGTGAQDIIYAGEGNDILSGDDGDDQLYGQGGNDILDGGAGNDRLYGGAGNDILTGSTGADRFIFVRGDGGSSIATASTDIITDFNAIEGDRIVISGESIIGVTVSAATTVDSANTYLITVSYVGGTTEYFNITLPNGTLNDANSAITITGGTATIDGTIVGATVYIDLNGNNQEDEGELLGFSDQSGHVQWVVDLAKLDVNGDGLFTLGEARAVQTGGLDIDTGLSYEINLFGPVGSEVISPLTSLLQPLLEAGIDYSTANALLVSHLGLPQGTGLIALNPITGTDEILAQNAAVMTAAVQFAELAAVHFSADEAQVSFLVFGAISKALLDLPEGKVADFSDIHFLQSISAYLGLGELANPTMLQFMSDSQKALQTSLATLAPGENALGVISEVQHITQGNYAQMMDLALQGHVSMKTLNDLNAIVFAYICADINLTQLTAFNTQLTTVLEHWQDKLDTALISNPDSGLTINIDTLIHQFTTENDITPESYYGVQQPVTEQLASTISDNADVQNAPVAVPEPAVSEHIVAAVGIELHGTDGNDILSGGNGDDLLFGMAGDDILNGGEGNDLLVGGSGNDILTGGGGLDIFAWNNSDVNVGTKDTITDFKANSIHDYKDASILNLSDILDDEYFNENTLDNYLHVAKSGEDTTIAVDPNGAGNFNSANALTIILSGVDLTATFATASSTDILNHLIANGNLITEA